MKKLITIIMALALVAAVIVGVAACGNSLKDGEPVDLPALETQEIRSYAGLTIPADFKIGMICLHDESSTYDLNFINAAKAAVAALGMNENQLVLKTGIDEGEICYTTAVDLVNQGCNVIFADSFGHEAFMLRAAQQYPNVQFCHATGTMAHTAGVANFHNAFASIYEGRYLAGIAAGLKLNEMIKDGKITAAEAVMGYVGAYPYEEVKSGYTSFYLGAKSVCPSVTMQVQFTGSWFDIALEKAAAENLISKKCVLISQHADSMGAPPACEAAGVPNVSY
ncbi:MAG: BMP family ABC transporter substrate-binding protein, partial [Clostridia bacterium]|nr:BMP family ABC transporter substrate-binding protein [Clostridia bacterium]